MVKIISKISVNASYEEKKQSLERMIKKLRTAFNARGGIKEKLEEHDHYVKPSEKNRLKIKEMKYNRERKKNERD